MINGQPVRPRPRWQRAVMLRVLQAYAFAWGVTHPAASVAERVDATSRMVLWGRRKGWL